MCCFRLTHVQQNTFMQYEYNSLNFGVRIKTSITKSKDDNLL